MIARETLQAEHTQGANPVRRTATATHLDLPNVHYDCR
jgi:hypothetical protein